jgi:hypothetical protein
MSKERQIARARFFKRHNAANTQGGIRAVRGTRTGRRENIGERKMPRAAEESGFAHTRGRGRG